MLTQIHFSMMKALALAVFLSVVAQTMLFMAVRTTQTKSTDEPKVEKREKTICPCLLNAQRRRFDAKGQTLQNIQPLCKQETWNQDQ
jgi:GTP cyclohydrolase FolE2